MDNYRINDKMQSAVKLAVMNRDIARASRKLGPQIHCALVQNLIHIRDHGDTTLLTRLFSVLPKGSRLKSYFEWCEKFAPVKVSRKAKSYGHVKVNPGHKREEFDIGGAMAITPWDFSSPNKGDTKVLEFDALIKLVTRHARKSIEAGKLTIDQVRGLSDRVAADLVTITVSV